MNTSHSILPQACCKGLREHSRTRGQQWTWHGSPVSSPARAQQGSAWSPRSGNRRGLTASHRHAGSRGRLREGPPPCTSLPAWRSLLGRAAAGSGHPGSSFCRAWQPQAGDPGMTYHRQRAGAALRGASERPPTLVPSLRPSSSFAAAPTQTAAASTARPGLPQRTRQGGSACSSCPRKLSHRPNHWPTHLARWGRWAGGEDEAAPRPVPAREGRCCRWAPAGPAPAPCPRPLGGAVPGGAVPPLASAAPARRGGEGTGVSALPRRERHRWGRRWRRLLTGTKRGRRGHTVRAGWGTGRGRRSSSPGTPALPEGRLGAAEGPRARPLPLPSALGRGDSAVPPARRRLPGSRPCSPRVPAGTPARRRRGVRPPASRCSPGGQGNMKQWIGEAVRARSPRAGRCGTSARGAGGAAPAGGCGGWGEALNFARRWALPRSATLFLLVKHPGVSSRRMIFFFFWRGDSLVVFAFFSSSLSEPLVA